jgi:hypothetical protein
MISGRLCLFQMSMVSAHGAELLSKMIFRVEAMPQPSVDDV